MKMYRMLKMKMVRLKRRKKVNIKIWLILPKVENSFINI